MTLKFDIRGSRTLGALWPADKRRNGRAAGCIDLKFDIRGSHTRENVNYAITGKELTYQQIVQHTDWAGKPRPLVALTNAPRSGSTHASPAALLRATRPARQQSASTRTSTPPHPAPLQPYRAGLEGKGRLYVSSRCNSWVPLGPCDALGVRSP